MAKRRARRKRTYNSWMVVIGAGFGLMGGAALGNAPVGIIVGLAAGSILGFFISWE